MPTIALGQWLPDASDFGNPGCKRVVNAVPGVNGYKPVNSLVVEGDALSARPRGAIEAVDASKNVLQYAGDASTLYNFSSNTWSDVSVGGGYSTGTNERWEFVRWKEQVIATNFDDNPQTITLGGTNFADLTTALRARHVAVVGNFLVFGNTFDSTDGTVRDRVRWSGINDETTFVVSPVTLSDFRDLKGGGIQRILGGEAGNILTEDSSFRMVFVGSPKVFQIDEIAPGLGLLAPGAAVTLGTNRIYLSEHGFVLLEGGVRPRMIGAGRVDNFVRQDIDEDHLDRVSAVADPLSNRVYFAYPGSGNTAGRPNKIIVYDGQLDRWGYIEEEVELLWKSGGVGTTLEGLDSISSSLDDLGASLDADVWKGSAPLLSAFDKDFKKANFSGSVKDATFETKELQLVPGSKARLNGFEVLVDGGTTTARVGRRDAQSETVSYTSSISEGTSGRFVKRTNARYHRFEFTATGGWTDAIGVHIAGEDIRRGPRR